MIKYTINAFPGITGTTLAVDCTTIIAQDSSYSYHHNYAQHSNISCKTMVATQGVLDYHPVQMTPYAAFNKLIRPFQIFKNMTKDILNEGTQLPMCSF